MAKVVAKVDCFINNSFRRAGDEFNHDGPLNPCIEYVDAPPSKEPAARRTTRKSMIEADETVE